jgi:putative hydrolase of HD superfamily
METKDNPPLDRIDGERLSALTRVYFELNHLKQLFRQGWLRRGVPRDRCESVAEHTFGVATAAMFLADACFPELDRERVLRMALLHDLGEIHAGDLTPADGVPLDEKRRREEASVRRALDGLPDADTYLELWREYEDEQTPEARFVRQIDRLEMGLQAIVYEQQQLADLGEFHASVDAAITSPELRRLLDELAHLRGGS